MRSWLLLIALATPVVLASPAFWWLLASASGAAPATAIYDDGTTQESLHGPKAPWPDWAVIPDEASLTVTAWFGPHREQPATGFGTLALDGPVGTFTAAYAAKLRAAGWDVTTYRQNVAVPLMPDGWGDRCILQAVTNKAPYRSVQTIVGLAEGTRTGRMHWRDGHMPPPHGIAAADC